MNIQSICSRCGGELLPSGENTFKCKFCGATFREDTIKKEKDALASLLDDDKREKISNLKRELWKKVSETYADSIAICKICRDIKALDPNDFYANFYEAANCESEDLFVEQLENMDVIEHYDDIEDVLNYSIKSISPRNMLAICNLIERAYKQNDLTRYNEFRTKYDEQCSLINDCVYDPAYPRDVFICYSSKDMDKVESLVKYLESQGLLCFVAIRNLQHGRGAVSNYWKALHTAIENCKCVVFLSSVNSRDLNCDALAELRYVLSLEQKLNKKIKKIEYLIDNYTGAPVERSFKKVFDGLEYCYDEETVFDRVVWDEPESAPQTEPVLVTQKEAKYCCNCGKENPDNAKFCYNCGKDIFVSTQEEFIEYLRKAKEDLEKQKQIAAEEPRQSVQLDSESSSLPVIERIPEEELDIYNDDVSEGAVADAVENEDYFSGNMRFVDVDVSQSSEEESSQKWQQNNSDDFYDGYDSVELIKGQNVILPENIKKIRVMVQNDYKLDNVEADLYVFLLDGNERVLSESDLVFFGNKTSLNKSVKLEHSYESEIVDIRFNKVNQDIAKIRFILSFQREDGKVRNFTMLNETNVTFLLEDQGYRFCMTDVGRYESVSAFELYRIRNKWRLRIQAAGLKQDINSLCGDYGIEVE